MRGWSAQDGGHAERLAAVVRQLNSSGHNPATSGNYSFRATSPEYCLVSESGVDKSAFAATHFLPVSYDTARLHPTVEGSGRRSSAETAVHVSIYRATEANCVLHSHLLEGLWFADLYPDQPVVFLEGMELLKGFKDVTTHDTRVAVPTFPNTQDMDALARDIEAALAEHRPAYGLLLRHHGLYVWGGSVEEAKRHLEVFEYLFKYFLQKGRVV